VASIQIAVFWHMMPCCLISHIPAVWRNLLSSQLNLKWGNRFLSNAGTDLLHCMLSQYRTLGTTGA